MNNKTKNEYHHNHDSSTSLWINECNYSNKGFKLWINIHITLNEFVTKSRYFKLNEINLAEQLHSKKKSYNRRDERKIPEVVSGRQVKELYGNTLKLWEKGVRKYN